MRRLAMYTYDIFDDMLNLRDVVNSFFAESAGRWRSREFPNIEIFEGQEELEIRALVPGIKSNDMDIYLIGDSLIIEGEKKDDYADNAYIRKERQFGKFKKSIKLPYRVDGNNIHADLSSGILSIKLQMSADAKPKKIEIK
jgi:HSP20 family protein